MKSLAANIVTTNSRSPATCQLGRAITAIWLLSLIAGTALADDQATTDTADDTKTIKAKPSTDPARDTPGQADDDVAYGPAQMVSRGTLDASLRTLYFTNQNAFFERDADRDTATIGGGIGLTAAPWHGVSFRLSAYAQRNFVSTSGQNGYDRDLGDDFATLGEAYLQWQGRGLQLRAGNQLLEAPPFTATYDYRIIPQLYQGVKLRYGDRTRYLMAMRIFRFKSRTSSRFDRTTNYNTTFSPFPPNTTQHTDGFWAVGGADERALGPVRLAGNAWFLNYQDYANLYYAEARIARRAGDVQPFIATQFARETDTGRALIGNVDNHTYGAQLGVDVGSLTASLNYDYMPSEAGTFGNGALATPYATQEASGPLFAQPFLTSTQDLGTGNAYAASITGAPTAHTFAGARYSYMDLAPSAGAHSIQQSEYLLYGIYHFGGHLEGLSLMDFVAYQTQTVSDVDYWENRLKLQYAF